MSGGSTMDEVLKQDSLGRVRTPLEKRIAIVEAFEGGGMSAARFARHHGLNYSTLCSWIQAVRSQRRGQNPAMHSSSGGAMRWLEAVVESGDNASTRAEISGLCVEWRGARMRVKTPTQISLAAALIRELEGAAC
jgi:transposase-like protein